VLDDNERNALRELERQLATEDPWFVQTFDRHQERMSDQPRHRHVARIVLAVALAVCALLLLLGSPIGALAVAVTVASAWLVWRFSSHLDPQSLP